MSLYPLSGRGAAALALALALAGCGGADASPSAAATPAAATPAAAASGAAGSGTGVRPSVGVDSPALPPSLGQSVLFHLQLATDIDAAGNPVGQATQFASGTQAIFGLLGWQYVPAGTELRLRLFRDDRLVSEQAHSVVNESGRGDDGAGFVYAFRPEGGFADGDYTVEVGYNGLPDEIVPFSVGGSAGHDVLIGSGTRTGPIPYPRPADVLVVTRASALRRTLGRRADEVLAAAARVGDLHDLEADGTRRTTASQTVAETQRLLRARPYRYLLILGNDDAVPYTRLKNPLADSEASALSDWDLPADWIPTDNFYTDLDGDDYGTPDLPVARIPSSDDADLLLTQLSDILPPDGSGFALVNQERKSQAGIVLNAISSLAQVQLEYSPPTEGEDFGRNATASGARYLYVLLHGIGVATDSWAANTVSWTPGSARDPLAGEWSVADSSQVDSVTVASDPTSRGVVQVGACYGAWTLDTVQAPRHKTADNNLALHYLRSGTRAYIADTHLSYSVPMGPADTPSGRTGFEVLFWRAVAGGMTPIDAFQAAKAGTARAIDELVAAGDIDAAKITLKTLHYMVYLGRP